MPETRKMKSFARFALAFAALTLVLMSLSYSSGVTVMTNYACPLVFAFAGMALYAGGFRKQTALQAGAAFVGWYVLSRMLMGELMLEYSFTMFSNLCCAYLLAFPFAHAANDSREKRGLKTAAVIFAVGYGLMAWTGVYAALMNRPVNVPFLGTQISMHEDMRLYACNHPNISACMFLIALMLGAWLITRTRRRWLIPVLLVMAIGAYIGIALADSRTTMLQVCCFAAGAAFLAMLRLPLRARWARILLGLIAAVLCLAVVFVSFDWVTDGMNRLSLRLSAQAEEAQQAVSNRDLMNDLTTMTGRTDIYRSLLQVIREQPRILLTGLLNSKIVQVIRAAAGHDHAHNAFLQTVLNVGLPGLLLAVFFTLRALWASLRLIFSAKAAFADQLLGIILLVFLVGTIPEPYLFTDYLTIANMPFFLVFGYVLEAERALRA